MDCLKLQANSSCQMVRDTSGLEVFETRSVARYPRRHDSVAGWNECIRSFRPSAFGLWVMLLFEYTMPFSSFFFEDRDSTRGHKKGRDSSQVWTKHLLCEWAIHQACDKRCWTDELGSDAKSRGPGLRFVHKSCLARGHFRVFDESEAFMATRGAKCLVLHVGQPSKFGYWSVAAKSKRFSVRSCSASLQNSFGCAKPSWECLHEALVWLWSLFGRRRGQDHCDCKGFQTSRHPASGLCFFCCVFFEVEGSTMTI